MLTYRPFFCLLINGLLNETINLYISFTSYNLTKSFGTVYDRYGISNSKYKYSGTIFHYDKQWNDQTTKYVEQYFQQFGYYIRHNQTAAICKYRY